ncbi:MAG: ABC transporter ATP-binding protein/permease [Cyanobacteria bacterium]|nr:ABC transporter ATP-binding protein/permease [Cyanobacteriota bacterium]
MSTSSSKNSSSTNASGSSASTAMPPTEEEMYEAQIRESGLQDIVLLKKLWPFIRPQWKPLLFALILLPLITAAEMLQPFIVKQAIDGPVRTGDVQGLWQLSGMFLGLLALHYTLRFFQMKMAQVASGKIIFNLRTHLYNHLQKLSRQFYHQYPIGKLVTRITSDVENLSEMFSSGGIAILADLGLITGAIIGMFIMEPQLALYTSIMLPVMVWVMDYFRRKSRRAYDEIRINTAQINAYLQENISGMEMIQLFNREDKNLKDFQKVNDQNLKVNLSSVFYDSSLSAVVELLTNFTIILVLWFGGQAIMNGHMTFGLLVAYFQFVQMMFSPIEDVTEKYTIIQAGLASIDKIMALLNQVPMPPEALHPIALGKAKGDIEFKQVSFGYVATEPVLKDVSFRVKPGQKVAIVGPSGAGKTTIIKLLSRFYDPTQGSICLDGVDLREYETSQLRKNIITIQQDDFLFSRNIAENVTLQPAEEIYQNPEALKRLQEALALSNATRINPDLQAMAKDPLQERGRNLSGGERQLLLFARAIYHDPTILVLDEATASIDPYTETLVQEAMNRLMENRTSIIIAHRLVTIQQADLILVLEAGHIIETGTHSSLLEKNGTYAQFYRYQEIREKTEKREEQISV